MDLRSRVESTGGATGFTRELAQLKGPCERGRRTAAPARIRSEVDQQERQVERTARAFRRRRADGVTLPPRSVAFSQIIQDRLDARHRLVESLARILANIGMNALVRCTKSTATRKTSLFTVMSRSELNFGGIPAACIQCC